MFKGVINLDINSGRKVLCDSEAFSNDDPRSRYPESKTLCDHYIHGSNITVTVNLCVCVHHSGGGETWGICNHPEARELALTSEDAILEDRLERI